jgi:hypothetical protein
MKEFFFSMQPVHLLNSLLAELYRTPQRFCLLSTFLCTCSNALLAELSKNPSMILFYPVLSSA